MLVENVVATGHSTAQTSFIVARARSLQLASLVLLCWSQVTLGDQVDFNRDIRPILSDKCYACHGPDEAARQAELRLDSQESALGETGSDDAAFVPFHPDRSLAIERIFSSDADWRMPPPESNLELSDDEKHLLRQWVQEGANWDEHWAFAPPVAATPPDPSGASWCRNQIDRFVLAGLEDNQLLPAPEAERATLVRRLWLDLCGLPPSAEQVAAFVHDPSPDAYERLVDRLLASESCAERLALDWMDLARYADSHGLHADGARRMWPWRDWVIEKFHENMPYDQFVTWQLAGDLLPTATHEQRLATAFLRNHPMTAEGGAIDEEFRLSYVFDRMETTGTAFLGMTVGCARCHDHKFDPISQREYYRFSAFFNNVRELGMTGDDGDFGPLLALPDDQAKQQLKRIDAELQQAADQRQQIREQAKAEFDQVAGEAGSSGESLSTEPPEDLAAATFPLDRVEKHRSGDSTTLRLDGNSAATVAIEPRQVESPAGNAIHIDGEHGYLDLSGHGLFDVAEQFSAALWVKPGVPQKKGEAGQCRVLLGTAGHKNTHWRGWEFFIDEQGHLAVWLIHARPDNLLHVRTRAPVDNAQWTHVAFAYDGTGRADGLHLFVNGKPADRVVVDDQLDRSIFPLKGGPGYPRDEKRAIRVGRSYRSFTGDFGVYQGAIDDIRLYELALTNVEVAALYDHYDMAQPGDGKLALVAHRPAPARHSDHRFEHWLARSHKPWQQADQAFREKLAERVRVLSDVPQLMIMEEMPEPRATHMLHRGEYNQPGEQVDCGTPQAILPWSKDRRSDRLGLARWMFDPDNPLTARVAVNRYWQMLFGHGLVRTPHDFGIQGERPTHPELLDWLAVRFRESGWDVRHLLKLIATSSTYRQSSSLACWQQQNGSAAVADPSVTDPQNRLLWRGPSHRLPAEFIRDSALAASGLLVRKVGGPSVKPYQPAGLWKEKNNFSQDLITYKHDSGQSLYRRSLYTFIRRTSPPPAMLIFDATNRSVCTVKREVTNTPLQALVLLNDPQFVEASRVLAQRVLEGDDQSDRDCIAEVFRALLGRRPNDEELSQLESLYEKARQRYGDDPALAELLLQVGESPCPDDLATVETAALAVVANTVMNFDAFYMKR